MAKFRIISGKFQNLAIKFYSENFLKNPNKQIKCEIQLTLVLKISWKKIQKDKSLSVLSILYIFRGSMDINGTF